MNSRLNDLKEGLAERKQQLAEITAEIKKRVGSLEDQRIHLKKSVEAYETLIVLEEEVPETLNALYTTTEPLTIERFSNTPAEDAYKELAKTDFKDKIFTKDDIKNSADKQGLRTRKDKFVSDSYCRAILSNLVASGFLVRPSKGKYRYNEQQQKDSQSSQGPLRQIDF